jgi:CBS domain-containing protein
MGHPRLVKIRDLMTVPVVTVDGEATLEAVAETLVRHRINAAPVVDGQGRLAGIISEGDLVVLEWRPGQPVAMAPARGQLADYLKASQVMTTDVITVSPEADSSEAARVMWRRHVKTLPVVEDGRLVGIVARRNLLRLMVERERGLQARRPDRVGSA